MDIKVSSQQDLINQVKEYGACLDVVIDHQVINYPKGEPKNKPRSLYDNDLWSYLANVSTGLVKPDRTNVGQADVPVSITITHDHVFHIALKSSLGSMPNKVFKLDLSEKGEYIFTPLSDEDHNSFCMRVYELH